MTVAARITADLAKFFNTGDFATAVSYTPASAAARSINVQWYEPYEYSAPAEIPFENSGPAVLARTSDVSAAKQRETIVKTAVTYYVIAVHPTGDGTTFLLLSKQ